MLEPLPVRIYKARRAATQARVTGSGMPQDESERWLAAWEAHAAAEGLDGEDRDFWQRGPEWIGEQRDAKQAPAGTHLHGVVSDG